MRALRATWLFSLALFAFPLQASPQTSGRPITLGYFPIVSTVALFKRFIPLADYLSKQLNREITLETARDFLTFVERTAERRYDIVVTAPHFAVRAADSGKYQIRATSTKDVQQLVVVHSDSPVTRLDDLANNLIATPPAMALITMVGKRHLADAGLNGDRAPVYRAFLSHNAANEAVIGRETEAAIASSNVVSKSQELGTPLRILSRGLKLPNMATLVACDLPPEVGEQLVQALVAMHNNEEGRAVLKHIGFPGYRQVTAKDYDPARPYAYGKKILDWQPIP